MLILHTYNVTDEDMTERLYSPKAGKYVKLTVADTGIGMEVKLSNHEPG